MCLNYWPTTGTRDNVVVRPPALSAAVADVEQTLASAESHGGSRVYGPMAVDDRMQTGAFRDPAGNLFGVYHRAAS
jgi:predicted enzyme related to lactoylglutathione lyase